MPLEPPQGWAALQERARRATDPKDLASIIDEMNKMLAEHEEASGDHGRKPHPKNRGARRAPAASKNKQR